MLAGSSIELAISGSRVLGKGAPTTKYLAEAPQFQNDA
jgi:hypothetical protein